MATTRMGGVDQLLLIAPVPILRLHRLRHWVDGVATATEVMASVPMDSVARR